MKYSQTRQNKPLAQSTVSLSTQNQPSRYFSPNSSIRQLSQKYDIFDKSRTEEERAYNLINSTQNHTMLSPKYMSKVNEYRFDILVPSIKPVSFAVKPSYDFKSHYLNDPEYENKMSKRIDNRKILLKSRQDNQSRYLDLK